MFENDIDDISHCSDNDNDDDPIAGDMVNIDEYHFDEDHDGDSEDDDAHHF
jgi:hypothetical protein